MAASSPPAQLNQPNPMPTETIPTTPYTVVKTRGIWEVLFNGKVARKCLLEAMADLYARAWNANRQPTNEELSAALSK